MSKLLFVLLAAVSLLGAAPTGSAASPASGAAAALGARYAALEPTLRRTPFDRPLVLESSETSSRLNGEIHAVIDQPFAATVAGLRDPGQWCDLLLLHINTKYCHAKPGPAGTVLDIAIGRKTPQVLAEAARMELGFSATASTPDHLQIELSAPDGPMGTSDYRIRLEAIALDDARTFLHFTYSYAYDPLARLAMRTYLNTIGANKVGFTPTGTSAGGRPDYVGGMRGLSERNTMRYYLAIEAYLAGRRLAPAQQLDARLQSWFSAPERYPRQLKAMSRGDYLTMKRAEALRQAKAD